MSIKEAKKSWWRAVALCLVKFHKFNPRQAGQKARRHRERLAPIDKGPGLSMLYHYEPFHIAEEIAGKEVTLTNEEYILQYVEGVLDQV